MDGTTSNTPTKDVPYLGEALREVMEILIQKAHCQAWMKTYRLVAPQEEIAECGEAEYTLDARLRELCTVYEKG